MSEPKRYTDLQVWEALHFAGSTNGWVRWEDYARLKAEIERLRKAGDWRPIETAPKDGKTVVLVVEYGYVYTGIFHNDGYCQDLYGAGLDPTNWMPLPNPPAKEGKQS